MIGVYMIKNKINNKIYIGESTDITKRWMLHMEELKKHTHKNYKLQMEYVKYGLNAFEFTILLLIDDRVDKITAKALCLIFEDKYIKRYDSIDNGYNIERTMDKIMSGDKKIKHINKRVIDNVNKQLSDKVYKKIDKIIYKVNDFKCIEKIDKKWLDVPLTTAMKKELIRELQLTGKYGRDMKWSEFKSMLKESGYKIENSKEYINGKETRVSIITKK